ncbi:MAG: aminopeptidase P family protein [Alphaproteobacteria bacterium]|nr:aminopeptidase P family protein [Alphaproteobacteria bacterium]
MTPPRGFDRFEFETRLARLQGDMALDDLDALLLTEEHDIRYITGFMTPFWQSPTRPWFVVVPRNGLPVAVIPSIGREAMSRGFTGAVHCWPSPLAEDDGISLLGQVIRDLVGRQPVLGMMMGAGTKLMMPLMDVELLIDSIGAPELVDATVIMQATRMVKSEDEIAKIAHVCGLMSGVFEALPTWARTGMTVGEVFTQFKIKALEAGVDDVSYLVGNAGAGGYDDIISPPGPVPVAQGDVLMLDTGSVWDGYFCDFDRNFGFGEVSAEAREAYELLWQATEDALTSLKPGMTSAELFGVMQNRIGGDDDSVGRYGHGLGIQLTEPPSHISWDETVLLENMVLTLEPSMALPGGKMMVHEENILLTAEGPRLLTTRAAPQLPIIG